MNRLKHEKSPYLLQHAENPVEWYPWGNEAFDQAKLHDKPIFLSIGYATCHWCHVMEHESFEDAEVSKLMNNVFVNIKVDREERPDIDNTYMTICQMLTGHGGWPLTIIMTPEKKPFYAATYLPKNSQSQRIGMLDLVPSIDNAWKNDRQKIMEAVDRIENGFTKTLELGKNSNSVPEDIETRAFDTLCSRFDHEYGGFGTAPKFPSAHNILFLLNYYRKSGDSETLQMITTTLNGMRYGGIWDHIGFGFHRYSTDREWLLPHFEKMLYDQAMLMMAYSEAWKETGIPLFKQTVYEISKFVEKYLMSEHGAFYSALDADSDGEEGKFYVWSVDEIRNVLTENESSLFLRLYQFQDNGNFQDEVTREKTGFNIPYIITNYETAAFDLNIETDRLKDKLENIRKKIDSERSRRIHPLTDDKILTDWNGLMIASYALAGSIFNEPDFIKKAENAWSFLNRSVFRNNGELHHRIKDNEASIDGMADDYVFLIYGLLELYNATFHPEYLVVAINLHKTFNRLFLDKKYGGYYFTSEFAEPLLGRQKEIYDGALPSSNSVAARNGFRISKLTGDPSFAEESNKIFNAFSEPIKDAPAGYTFALNARLLNDSLSTEIIITAPEMNENIQKLVHSLRSKAPSNTVMIIVTNEWKEQLENVISYINNYPLNDKTVIYICQNFHCKAPVYSLNDALDILDQMPNFKTK